LSDVSSVPLQQSLKQLETAYKNYFDLEDLNVSGLLKNRKLARRISLQGWREFRTLIESKSEKFDRDFRVISRWEPTSQKCSDCGFKWGKIDLSVRSILCLSCGIEHDRDENASKNIEMVGMGHRHDRSAELTAKP
jgi:putative transposase